MQSSSSLEQECHGFCLGLFVVAFDWKELMASHIVSNCVSLCTSQGICDMTLNSCNSLLNCAQHLAHLCQHPQCFGTILLRDNVIDALQVIFDFHQPDLSMHKLPHKLLLI